MIPTTDRALSEVLATTRHVLVDFDGPICSIFAGRAASLIAEELAALIRTHDGAVPDRVLSSGDPLDVLRHAGRLSGPLALEVERALQTVELAAAATALPTHGAAEFLAECRLSRRLVAIVSNNSAPAVARYLESAGLSHLVARVEGRDPGDPGLMKPDPTLVFRALRALGGQAESAVLIGDSASDLEAARAAGVQSIGYANKAGKADKLAAAGAAVVVTSMIDLAASVRASHENGARAGAGSSPLGAHRQSGPGDRIKDA